MDQIESIMIPSFLKVQFVEMMLIHYMIPKVSLVMRVAGVSITRENVALQHQKYTSFLVMG